MDINSFVQSLTDFAYALLQSLRDFGVEVLRFIPNLIGAFVLLWLGKLIAQAFKNALLKLFDILKVEKVAKQVGVSEGIQELGIKVSTSEIFGIILYWVIYLVFVLAAVEVLGVQTISDIVGELIAYIPNIVGAVLVMLVGITVANFIEGAISHVKDGKFLGKIAYFVIIVVVSVSALEQLGFDVSFFTDNVNILVAGLSLALGLSFGLGGKDKAKKLIDKLWD